MSGEKRWTWGDLARRTGTTIRTEYWEQNNECRLYIKGADGRRCEVWIGPTTTFDQAVQAIERAMEVSK